MVLLEVETMKGDNDNVTMILLLDHSILCMRLGPGLLQFYKPAELLAKDPVESNRQMIKSRHQDSSFH
jgi:hypothetical protein